MHTKIIRILIFLMLFCTAIPVIESSSVEDNNETLESKYFGFIFVRGKVENVREENHNGTLWYNCSIVDVIYVNLRISINPLKVISFDRDHLIDFPFPLWLPKDTFYGIIQEGFIFGMAFIGGE